MPSLSVDVPLQCPLCGYSGQGVLWLVVDATANPDLELRIANGTIHTIMCPACRQPAGDVKAAPLILFHPERPETTLFSPSEGTLPDDREGALDQLRALRRVADDRWREEWVTAGTIIVPRKTLQETMQSSVARPPRSSAPVVEEPPVDPTHDNLTGWMERLIAARTQDDFVRILATYPDLLSEEAVALGEQWKTAAIVLGQESRVKAVDQTLVALRHVRDSGLRKDFGMPPEDEIDAQVAEKFAVLPPHAQLIVSRLLGRGAIRLATPEELEERRRPKESSDGSAWPSLPEPEKKRLGALLMLFEIWRVDTSGTLALAAVNLARDINQSPAMRGDPFWEPILHNMKFLAGSALLQRADQGPLLDEVISDLRSNVAKLPPNLPGHGSHLANLALALRYRFDRNGDHADLEEGLAYIVQAIEKTLPDEVDWPEMHCTYGLLLVRRYETDAGSDVADLECALAAAEVAAGAEPEAPSVLALLAAVLVKKFEALHQQRDIDRGIEAFERAAALTPTDHPQRCNLLHSVGMGYFRRFALQSARAKDDLGQAIGALESALASATPESPMWVKIMGDLQAPLVCRYQEQGSAEDLETAIRLGRRSLEYLQVGTHDWSVAKGSLGSALLERYYLSKQPRDREMAVACFREILDVGDGALGFQVILTSCRNLGAQLMSEKDWAGAGAALQMGVIAANRAYESQLFHEGRDASLLVASDIYRDCGYVLARQGAVDAAIVVLEQGRARALEMQLGADLVKLLAAHPQHVDRLHAFEAASAKIRQLDRFGSIWQPVETPAGIHALNRKQADEARDQMKRALEMVREVPGYERFFTPITWPDIVQGIGPDAATAYFITTVEGSATIVVHTGARQESTAKAFFHDAFTQRNLRKLLRDETQAGADEAYLDGILSRPEILRKILPDTLRTLGTAFVAEMAKYLRTQGYAALNISPAGSLALLPFHAAICADDGEPAYLTETFAVSQVLSSAMLSASRRRLAARNTPAVFLGIGGGPAALLPNARIELAEVAGLLRAAGASVVGTAAGREVFAREAHRITHLHFACHGLFLPDRPMESVLALDSSSNITLGEIVADFPLNEARLVVLSACQTGLAEFRKLPDELVGFPSGFIQAGAAGVVSSLWPVEDLSTALLMTRFYEEYLALGSGGAGRAARALQTAQKWLRNATVEEILLFCRRRHSESEPGMESPSWLVTITNRLAFAEPSDRPFSDAYYWASFVYTGG